MKKEEKYLQFVRPFKTVVCSKCHCWDASCSQMGDHWFMACPQFFNYRMYGKAMTVYDFLYQHQNAGT